MRYRRIEVDRVSGAQYVFALTELHGYGSVEHKVEFLSLVRDKVGNRVGRVEGHYHRLHFAVNIIICERCEFVARIPLNSETVSAAESGYTGLLNTTGGEGRVLLVQGVLQKDGWFTWGEDMCHVAANGLIHSIVPLVDTATCLTNGQLKATCTECGDVYRGQATWAKGHTWDESYVCTVCGTQGTDIANATLTVQYAYYSYTGNAIRPYSEATYNGTKLVASSDRYGTDAYISYENNLNIGVGTVTYEGRGNFYGSISKSFTIVPASVSTIRADRVDTNSVTLSWSAAKGAQTYMIQQQQSDGSWVRVGSTSGTSFTVTNLSMKTDYVFRVHTMATVDGKDYYCLS